jgi:hypothetical protein
MRLFIRYFVFLLLHLLFRGSKLKEVTFFEKEKHAPVTLESFITDTSEILLIVFQKAD